MRRGARYVFHGIQCNTKHRIPWYSFFMPEKPRAINLRLDEALNEKVVAYAMEKYNGNMSLAIRNILRRSFRLKEEK